METEIISDQIRNILESEAIEASAPCRIDMGGTLDISTFYYPLRHLNPCTFNIAIGLRTRVRLLPYDKNRVKVSSTGFESAEYAIDEVPFDHPLGLIFAVAAYFRIEGIHVDIESSSPPRSALGGSSVAAVALIAALSKLISLSLQICQINEMLDRKKIAILAHALEASVAGVPCGLQDQLAAAFGGINAWYWRGEPDGTLFEQKPVVEKEAFKELEQHLLLAYCGIPHESKNINQRWVQQFLSGRYRKLWADVIGCTQKFVDALSEGNFQEAVKMMNRETAIRKTMTPDVLDDIGKQLFEEAIQTKCGARFTGAGGGGCLWALGETENINKLKEIWNETLSKREGASLLDVKIDSTGLCIDGY